MCGLLGVFRPGGQAADYALKGISFLQHRGQDGAGLATFDKNQNRIHLKKGLGAIPEALFGIDLGTMQGNMAIAHTRYDTVGSQDSANIQPFVNQNIIIAHNGNLTNTDELKNNSRHFLLSDSDLEYISYAFSNLINNQHHLDVDTFFAFWREIKKQFQGAYAIMAIIPNLGLFAATDEHSIRPLNLAVIGDVTGDMIMLSSESCVYQSFTQVKTERSLGPNASMLIDFDGNIHFHTSTETTQQNSCLKPCMFEWIYFQSVNSNWHQRSVYQVRQKLGTLLAQQIQRINLSFDSVSAVPETGRTAAISIANHLRLPYTEILIKNRYGVRSFIGKDQAERQAILDNKFQVIPSEVTGKHILLVDDSLVRGNTAIKFIEQIKCYKPQSITLVLTCPPITHPCNLGIDFPDARALFSYNKDIPAMQADLDIDHLVFLTLEQLYQAIDLDNLCVGCLSGVYPQQSFQPERIPMEVK